MIFIFRTHTFFSPAIFTFTMRTSSCDSAVGGVFRNFSRIRFAFDLCSGALWMLARNLFRNHEDKERNLRRTFWLFDVKCVRSSAKCVGETWVWGKVLTLLVFFFRTDSFVRIFTLSVDCGASQLFQRWHEIGKLWTDRIARTVRFYLAIATNAKPHRWKNGCRAFWCHLSLHRSICSHLKTFKHIFVRLFAK